MRVYGATFLSPTLEHFNSSEVPCLTPFTGTVQMRCEYGFLNISSGCRQGCFAGNLTMDGGAFVRYPDLVSGDQFDLDCPDGYVGFARLECGDVVPFVQAGACYAHCPAERFYHGIWDVEHDLIYHTDTVEIPCKEGFDGYVVLKCTAGTVTLEEGGCYKRCANGRFIVRMGITMRHARLAHDEVTPSMPCPEGYVGSVRLLCTNGIVSIGEGGCPSHCSSGVLQGSRYKAMLHLENASLMCPVAGTLQVSCVDGEVTQLGGLCYQGCEAGMLRDENGSSIMYPTIDHLGNVTGACGDGRSGYVQVNCSDGVAMLDALPGQRCFLHCTEGVNLTTSDGAIIYAPPIDHGQQVPVKCPATPGTVTVRCSDSVLYIGEGNCGPSNCAAGKLEVGQTKVPHPEINDGFETEAPSQCPGEYLGEAIFSCKNGTVEALNVSLVYPAIVGLEAVNFSVDNYSQEFLMERENEYFELCGCCIPPDPPPGSQPISGVDLRKIIFWAVGLAFVGVLASFCGGIWLMRPPKMPAKLGKLKRKMSRIAPSPEEDPATAKKGEAIVEYKPRLTRSKLTEFRETYDGKAEPTW